ncbi:hypothetical protein CCZ01_00805 [Helicobacter monodelphidis]|uniref:phospholipid:lipid A palmitoyltransferase n=1 Tax=Helicobacter sp. 15-1451 TaxID=2004995 RepID=UPI000DCEB8D3|nr:phospholipid:lipid A palmitoyltransferase [Helicobacter sp. 15-1451]RAX59308.1 hypothetical protein CCZ01_00805 [Helicobacter sp. 15-1451]
MLFARIIKIFILTSILLFAEEESFMQLLSKIYNKGDTTLLIPLNTWHNRFFYDARAKSYTELPWGIGVSKIIAKDRRLYGLYAIAFKDSHNKFQTMYGYLSQYYFALDSKEYWKVAIGYTLGITQRYEYRYIPLPLPLPTAGFSYQNVYIQMAYVPGIPNVKNWGNVLFTWLSWQF